jgi:MFS family permease
MSDPLEEEWQRAPRGVPPQVSNAVRAVRVDLSWLHAAWMGLAFSRGFSGEYSVVEHREPEGTGGAVGYRAWAAVGALFLCVAYPLFVVGLATRFYARRIDRLSASLGFAGVALLSGLVWGVLTAATYLSSVAFGGFVAVAVAGTVATVSAVLALYVSRREGRRSTVLVGYPLGVTAIFLPPVVASLYSPTLAAVVFPRSESLAIWLLDNVLAVGGLAAFIRASFDLQGLAYVGMWFLLAVPVGWALGGLVTLVSGVRQAGDRGRRRRG